MKRFFYHFNKPKSQQEGKVIWSVHYEDKCHFVEHIDCRVPAKSKAQKRQPRAIMIGKATSVTVKDGVAIIE